MYSKILPLAGSARTLIVILTTSILTVMLTLIAVSSFHHLIISNYDNVKRNYPQSIFDNEVNEFNNDSQELHLDDRGGDADALELREIAKPKPGEICKKRFPQAIIVGIQKSGTTALLKFLSVHPQIAACLVPMETMYFSMYYKTKPLSWYRNLMPCSYSNQITMEKSPPYFYRGFCAERIRKMNPDSKIIIIIKDPIERAISMYAMLNDGKLEGAKTFENSVTTNKFTKINTGSRFIDFSNYPKHMQAWLNNFKLEQILMVDGHNMELDPAEELHRVESFLHIGQYFTPDRFLFNETKGKYCLMSDDDGIQCLGAKKGRPHPEVNTTVRKLLENYFRPLNEKFFSMINRRFDWGY